jgi:hypothetical protein
LICSFRFVVGSQWGIIVGQIVQWPLVKGQTMIYKTLHRKLSNTTKLVTSEGELRCFGMVSTSYSTIDTRRVAVVRHEVWFPLRTSLRLRDDSGICTNQHFKHDFYSSSSQKQQFADRHVALLEHNIPTPSKSVFSLTA